MNRSWLLFILCVLFSADLCALEPKYVLQWEDVKETFEAITPEDDPIRIFLQAHRDAGTVFAVVPRPPWYSALTRGKQGYWDAASYPAPAIIEIFEDVDCISAVLFLRTALVTTSAHRSVSPHLEDFTQGQEWVDQLNVAQRERAALIGEALQHGAEAAKMVISVASTPLDIVITTADVVDGKAPAWTIGLSAIPLVSHLPLAKPIKVLTEAGEDILSLTADQVKLFKKLVDYAKAPLSDWAKEGPWVASSSARLASDGVCAMRRRSTILSDISDAIDAGRITEAQAIEFIAYLRRNFPNAIPVRIDTGKGSKYLAERLDLGNKPKGLNPDVDAHHYAMQKWDEHFVRVGIDIHSAKYGEWLDSIKHDRYHNDGMPWSRMGGDIKTIEEATDDFFRDAATSPKSREEILLFLQDLMSEFPK